MRTEYQEKRLAQRLQLEGQRFGRLQVLWPVGRHGKQSRIVWACQCDDGNIVYVQTSHLTSGHTKSCGCMQSESATLFGKANFKNGHFVNGKQSPEYQAFKGARERCRCTTHKEYSNYGGRGIEFRFESFDQFMAELGPRPAGKSLDRINNDGHYEPGNVRWATSSEQQRNKRKFKWRRKRCLA